MISREKLEASLRAASLNRLNNGYAASLYLKAGIQLLDCPELAMDRYTGWVALYKRGQHVLPTHSESEERTLDGF